MEQDPTRKVLARVRGHIETGANATLPPEMLDAAIRRLGIIALGGAIFMAFALIALLVMRRHFDPAAQAPESLVSRVVFIVASLGMFWVARHRKLSRQRKANIGLVYEVIGAFGVGLTEFTLAYELSFPIGTVSIVAIWIVMLRLLVPATTLRAALTAGFAVATVPLAVRLVEAAGYPPVAELVFWGLVKTTAAAAALAVVASRTIYRLGAAVTQARQLGAYRLEEKLGGGGMGEVWRARHQLLRRPAAIKLIRREALGAGGEGDPTTLLKRFEREAQATASLRSIHTVELFDFGATESGAFYYAMELLDGIDMQRLVERFGPIPSERAAFLLDQVCHSLLDAHRHDMIHRDIKPANLFVCRLGPDYDFVKVLDFGLVKDTGTRQPGQDVRLTTEGLVPGTPSFMAPEMALGKPPIGPYTDVYMLGCVAYWLLSGELVFTGDTSLSVLTQHVTAPPPPIGERTEIEVPIALQELVMACLQKDPYERPQSVAEVRDRLAACRFDAPWTPVRAARWWEQHHPSSQTG